MILGFFHRYFTNEHVQISDKYLTYRKSSSGFVA